MAQRTRKLDIVIAGDAKGAQRAMSDTAKSGSDLQRKMDKVGGGIGSMFSRSESKAARFSKKFRGVARGIESGFAGAARGVGKAVKGIAFGVAGLAVFGAAVGKTLVDAATESLKIGKQTEAVIKSTGGVAKVSAGQVGDLADKLSLLSGVDDELIQQGENILLTFTGIRNGTKKTNKIFDRATAIALDMSVALGHDGVAGDAMVLGKALNDPEKGIAKLTKVGVTFTQQQKDQITWLSRSGDKMAAQKIILDELQREFGGSAAAQATAGDKLRTTWGNVQEQLGGVLLPIFSQMATWLNQKLPAAVDWLQPKLEQFRAWLAEEIPKAWDSLVAAWNDKGYPMFVAVRDFIEDPVMVWLKKLSDALGTKGLAYIFGFVLVAAIAAYIGALALAAIANVAAFWEIYLVVGALAALAGALWWAEDRWGLLSGTLELSIDILVRVHNAVMDIKNGLDAMVGTLRTALDLIDAVLDKAPSLPTNMLVSGATGGVIGGVGGAVGNALSGLVKGGLPGFAEGGVVPGPMGAPTLALVHGGEEVLTPAQRGGDTYVTKVYVQGSVLSERELMQVIAKNERQGRGARSRIA